MFVKLRGLNVHYESGGNGNPVLLLHGWGADLRSLRQVSEFIRDSVGAKYYAIDFPGFGFSDTPSIGWDVNDFVSIVVDFLDKHRLEHIDIIAHSFGGRVAIKLASQYPERVNRLILVGSAGIRPKRTFSETILYHLISAKLVKKLTKTVPTRAMNLIRGRLLSRLGSSDYRNSGEMRETFVKIVDEDLRSFLPDIPHPTLLIWGELDMETPLADGKIMEEMIPNACLKAISGAGHYCFQDDFPTFSKIIASFYQGKRS